MFDSPSRDYEKKYEEKRDIVPSNYDNVILPNYRNEEDKFSDKNEYSVEHWKIIPYFTDAERHAVVAANNATDEALKLQDMAASQEKPENLSRQESLDELNDRFTKLNDELQHCKEELNNTKINLLTAHEIENLPPFGSNITPIV